MSLRLTKTDFLNRIRVGGISGLLLTGSLDAQINYARDNYMQLFNGLNKSGELALENSSIVGQVVPIPALNGWYVAKLGGSGTGDMALIADDGNLDGGGVYSYGSQDSVERALGLKGSGTHYAAVGAAFVNGTNITIPAVTITYLHEIWSVQGTTGTNASEDRLAFAYGLSGNGITGDNFLSSEAMTPVPELDAVSSSSRALTGVADATDPNRARDGNTEEWRQEVSASLTGLNWEPGQVLYVRWLDSDTGGFDAGHGIDDFQMEAGGGGVGGRSSQPDVGVKVDGEFSDWKRAKDLFHDPSGDSQIESGMDFLTLGGVVAADGLAIYIKTAEPHVLSNSGLRIYVDADGNPETGLAINGLGIEIMLNFSIEQDDQRFFPADALFYPETAFLPAGESIAEFLPNGLNSSQTHPASEEFEILIPLASLRGLEPGGRVGLMLRDRVSEFAPDLGQTFFIDVPYNIRPEGEIVDFEKDHPDDIRIASWNVLVNGPFDPDKEEAFGRQLAATKPDIINFQELYEPSAAWARDFVDKWLPLDDGQWYARKNNDCITVSRFAIKESWISGGNLIVQVDTSDIWGFDSVFVNAHTPAHVENQAPRISETTLIMLLLRRLMNGTEPSAPTGEFAIFMTGDLNANSPKIELSTQRTGTFVGSNYQPLNYWPDNYNLPLVDAAPRHTHTALPRLFTWRSLSSGNTQRLDYIYYQQSRVTKKGAYVVDTETMPSSFLSQYELQSRDSRGSDHLLIFADFKKREVDYGFEAQDAETPGWFFSQWLGWIYQFSENFHLSPLHGFLSSGPAGHGFWFWDEQLGWWFSRSGLYPYAYLHGSDSWIYFYIAPEPPRYYYDFKTDEWRS